MVLKVKYLFAVLSIETHFAGKLFSFSLSERKLFLQLSICRKKLFCETSPSGFLISLTKHSALRRYLDQKFENLDSTVSLTPPPSLTPQGILDSTGYPCQIH